MSANCRVQTVGVAVLPDELVGVGTIGVLVGILVLVGMGVSVEPPSV